MAECLFEIFMELLGDADIASDYIYYNSIRNNEDINIHSKNGVLAFCILGSFVFLSEKYYKLSTIKAKEGEQEYENKSLCYATGIMEDFPMLIILLTIRKETGQKFNTEGEISFWLATTSMFFKIYMYVKLTPRHKRFCQLFGRQAGNSYFCPTVMTLIVIIVYIALNTMRVLNNNT